MLHVGLVLNLLLLELTVVIFLLDSFNVVFFDYVIWDWNKPDFGRHVIQLDVCGGSWWLMCKNVDQEVVQDIHLFATMGFVNLRFMHFHQPFEFIEIFSCKLREIIKWALKTGKELGTKRVKLEANGLVLHLLDVKHQEWIQMLWKDQLSDVVSSLEVVLIVVLNFLLHVRLEALWVLFDDLIYDIAHLLNLTTK